MITFKYTL